MDPQLAEYRRLQREKHLAKASAPAATVPATTGAGASSSAQRSAFEALFAGNQGGITTGATGGGAGLGAAGLGGGGSASSSSPPAKRLKMSQPAQSGNGIATLSSLQQQQMQQQQRQHQRQQSQVPQSQVNQVNNAMDQVRLKGAGRNILRLLTWNIDGLDQEHGDIAERLGGVVETIYDRAPSIVLLQEVIEPTLLALKRFLGPVYEFIHPWPLPVSHPYFSVILVQRGRVGLLKPDGTTSASGNTTASSAGNTVSSANAVSSSSPTPGVPQPPPPHPQTDTSILNWQKNESLLQLIRQPCPALKRTPFPTDMGREMLTCYVIIDDLKIRISTSHLESQKIGTEKRKIQLDMALTEMVDAVSLSRSMSRSGGSGGLGVDYALFGGDLNLRDAEAKAALGKINPKPKGKAKAKAKANPAAPLSASGLSNKPQVLDAWEFAGSPEQHKATWDLQRNNNVVIAGAAYVPRLRFDRLYLSPTSTERLHILKFELVGTKRCEHGRFPSDHFGILTEIYFDKSDGNVVVEEEEVGDEEVRKEVRKQSEKRGGGQGGLQQNSLDNALVGSFAEALLMASKQSRSQQQQQMGQQTGKQTGQQQTQQQIQQRLSGNGGNASSSAAPVGQGSVPIKSSIQHNSKQKKPASAFGNLKQRYVENEPLDFLGESRVGEGVGSQRIGGSKAAEPGDVIVLSDSSDG